MSKCSKCEAELPAGARYCNKCGSPQIVAVSAIEEGTHKTTPPAMPIVTTPRPTQPDNSQSNVLDTETQPETPTSTLQDATSHSKTPPVLKSKVWPDASNKPSISLDEPDALVHPDVATSTSSSITSSDSQESTRPEVIVVAPTQPVQEPSRRKAAPGLIRPIGMAASPKPSTNPKTPIPRRPGQLPVTPIPPRTQGFIKSDNIPPVTSSSNERHMADQVTGQIIAQPSPPARPQQEQIPLREQVISNSTSAGRLYTSIENQPTGQLLGNGVQVKQDPPMRSQENLDATSRAAEHWRNSWRDRQRAEAGPIMDVSRGDASVPMPLMSMHSSLVRLRAIVVTNKEKPPSRSKNLMFWLAIILMICLIGGLGAYIVSTYLPHSLFGTSRTTAPQSTAQPTLTSSDSQLKPLTPGQTIHLHGEHFGANDPITFLLDSVTTITDANGKPITVQATSRGTFDVSLLIGKDWSASTHWISAQDIRTLLNAYLPIEVGIAGKPATSSNKLVLSVKELTFKIVTGQGDPGQQRVTLTNTSGAVLHWAATAVVDSSFSWLVINDNQISGTLNIGGSYSIGISVLPTGLATSSTPYTGQILFTINGNEQLTLPVELQVVDAQAEIIFSPNPLTGIVNTANGTCLAGTTLTLINLGHAVITWTLKLNSSAQSNISFLLGGKVVESGLLQSSGLAGDTQVLTLQCNNVHSGDTYQGTLYANSLQLPLVILIRTST